MAKRFMISILFYLPLSLYIFFGCKDDNGVEPPNTYVYQVPEKTNDGWETEKIGNVGIQGDQLYALVNLINYNIYKEVHSILIIKNKKLVFEEYFRGQTFNYSGVEHHGINVKFTKDIIHNQASVTKSFASTLVGIAIDKGYISSVDQKVYDFFPEYDIYGTDTKNSMTIEHLLTMSTGFEWNEGEYQYADSRNDLIIMWNVNDPLRHIMSKPLISEPGNQFYYNSGCTNILGEIVKRASGFNTDTFAKLFLFQPLGILLYQWEHFDNGVLFVSGDLKVRPRDMAKLGYIFLNNGKWKDNQVISTDWIEKSSYPSIDANSVWRYGYQWWIKKYSINSKEYFSFSARG